MCRRGRWSIRVAPADHVDVSVFARGLLNRVVTRIAVGEDVDIRLQGEGETDFYELR